LTANPDGDSRNLRGVPEARLAKDPVRCANSRLDRGLAEGHEVMHGPGNRGGLPFEILRACPGQAFDGLISKVTIWNFRQGLAEAFRERIDFSGPERKIGCRRRFRKRRGSPRGREAVEPVRRDWRGSAEERRRVCMGCSGVRGRRSLGCHWMAPPRKRPLTSDVAGILWLSVP